MKSSNHQLLITCYNPTSLFIIPLPPAPLPLSNKIDHKVCVARKESTSARDGSDGIAPLHCTHSAAAADANCRAATGDFPSNTATAYVAVKQSPAPDGIQIGNVSMGQRSMTGYCQVRGLRRFTQTHCLVICSNKHLKTCNVEPSTQQTPHQSFMTLQTIIQVLQASQV